MLEADAGADGVIAPLGALLPPIEPPAGASEAPIDGVVDGMVVAGGVVVDGDVAGGVVVVVLSVLRPQAPNAIKADRLTATRATDFGAGDFIGFPLSGSF